MISIMIIFVQFKDKQNYKSYVSAKLSPSLSNFVTAVLANEEILHQYMNSGKKEMPPDQAGALCSNFQSIGREFEEMLQASNLLKKANGVQTNPITANAAQDIHFFLARQLIGNGVLGDCTPAKSTLTLNEEQVKKMKGIYEISKQWSSMAKKRIPEAAPNGAGDVDWNLVVNDNVWVQLVKDYSAYANESGMGTDVFF